MPLSGEVRWAGQAVPRRRCGPAAWGWFWALAGRAWVCLLCAAALAGCNSSSSTNPVVGPIAALPAPADLTFNNGAGFYASTGSAGGTGGSSADGGQAVAVDGSGRILVAGFSNDGGGHRVLALWRFTTAGALDPSFAGTGVATSSGAACPGCTAPQDTGRALALDASGNILVAGTSRDSGGILHMALWRFTSTGILDSTFGSSGVVTKVGTAGAAGSLRGDVANGVAVATSGAIVVVGSSQDASGRQALALWRFTAAGTLDTTFGSGGTFTKTGSAGATGALAADVGNALALDGSGNIVVVGSSRDAQGGQDLALWRFTAAGLLDTTFASKGFLTLTGSAGATGSLAADVGNALALASGAIVVTGSSRDASSNTFLAVWRFTSAGGLDTSFHTVGYALILSSAGGVYDAGTSVAVDSQGRVLVAGFSQDLSLLSFFAVWRFTSSGTMDIQFVQGGIEGGDFDIANGIALDGSGRMLVTGQSVNNNQQPCLVLARFTNT